MLGGVSMMFEWFSSDFCFILVGFCKLVLVRLQNFGVIYNRLLWRGMHQIHAWPGHYLESSSALGNQLSIFFSGMSCTKDRFQIYNMLYRDRNPSVVFHIPFHFILLLHFLSSEALLSFFSFSVHFFIFNLMPRVQPFFWVVHVSFSLFLSSLLFFFSLFIHVFIVLSFFWGVSAPYNNGSEISVVELPFF